MRRRLLPPLVLAVALLLLAELAIRASDVDAAVLVPPSAVIERLVEDAGELARATWVTLSEILVGIVVALLIGLAVTWGMHRYDVVRRALHPLLVASQAVPTVVLAPPLALWLGYTFQTRVAVIALVAFFPIAVATADALRRPDPELVDLYRSLGASRWRLLRDVEAPGALPASFTGLRIAAVFSVVGAVFGEWVGSSDGLGYLLLTASNRLQTDLALACVVLLAALALALVGALTLAERWLTPWRRP